MGVHEEFIRMIDALLRLPAGEIGRAERLWFRLKGPVAELAGLEGMERKARRVLSEVLSSGARFERSAAACGGELGREMMDLARLDLERLKESLLALREVSRNRRFAEALLELASRGRGSFPPGAIIDDLLRSGVLSGSLSIQLRIRRKEVAERTDPHDLVRIAGLLVQLRRIRDGERRARDPA